MSRRQRASRLPAHRYDGALPTDRIRAEPLLLGSYHPQGGAPVARSVVPPLDGFSRPAGLRDLLPNPVEDGPLDPSVARSRVLLPGLRREAPLRARRDVLRSLLRPVLSPRSERLLGFCMARRQRRQVMFAKGVAGSRGIRHYRRTPTSAYSCR